MNKIKNLEQLRKEINRMQGVAKEQEQQLKDDLKAIREDLKPANIFWNTVSSLSGIKMDKNEFFKDGIAYGLSLLIRRFILKSEKKMENKVYDVVDSIFDRVKSFVTRFANHDARREERKAEREE